MRLANLSEFRSIIYTPNSAPSLSTLRRKIDAEKIPGGRKEDGRYFVDMDEYDVATNLRAGIIAKKAALADDPLLKDLI